MIDFFENLPPYLQALVAGITWLLTALGAASVFIFKSVNKRILTSMQGFAAGIMIAASFWSLLQPSIEYGKMVVCLLGYLLQLAFCLVVSSYVSSIQLFLIYIKRIGDKSQYREGVKTSLSKNTLLVLAITLHNIQKVYRLVLLLVELQLVIVKLHF